MDQIIVRPADHKDSFTIFQWRNDELSRKMSMNPEEIDWESHKTWYEAAQKNKNTLILVCKLSSVPDKNVGMVRLEIKPDRKKARISIILAQEYRGKGYAKQCLLSALKYVHTELSLYLEIYAEIRAVNIASLKLFQGVGFQLTSSDDHGYFTYELILDEWNR